MKKLLFVALFSCGLTISAFAQGYVNLDNINNMPTASPYATSGGLFFLDTGFGPQLMTQDFSASFYGGSDSANLALLATFLVPGNGTGDNFGPGYFLDPTGSSYQIPGATSFAFFKIEAWTGGGPDWASSLGYRNLPRTFSNPVATVPNPPPDLTGMPSIIIGTPETVTPEPSTFALLALGAAALITFRRRK